MREVNVLIFAHASFDLNPDMPGSDLLTRNDAARVDLLPAFPLIVEGETFPLLATTS